MTLFVLFYFLNIDFEDTECPTPMAVRPKLKVHRTFIRGPGYHPDIHYQGNTFISNKSVLSSGHTTKFERTNERLTCDPFKLCAHRDCIYS